MLMTTGSPAMARAKAAVYHEIFLRHAGKPRASSKVFRSRLSVQGHSGLFLLQQLMCCSRLRRLPQALAGSIRRGHPGQSPFFSTVAQHNLCGVVDGCRWEEGGCRPECCFCFHGSAVPVLPALIVHDLTVLAVHGIRTPDGTLIF